jgi:hypothetical protein
LRLVLESSNPNYSKAPSDDLSVFLASMIDKSGAVPARAFEGAPEHFRGVKVVTATVTSAIKFSHMM